MQGNPTPYPTINDLLERLLAGVRSVLGERLVGLYLYGSLASGDFDPGSSDVDFLAAVSERLIDTEVDALKLMHEELANQGGAWASRLEGGYVPLDWLRRHDSDDTSRHPFFTEDSPFGLHRLGWDWVIQRYVLREYGVVLYGPPPTTLIDPMSSEQLQDAVRETLRVEWGPHVGGPEWMRPRRYQAFVILTMCRALCVLDRGEFVSKPAAARWAEQRLASEWTPLIRTALAWREDPMLDDAALPETLRFLRFALSQVDHGSATA